ncbi:MAG: ABC transporter permease [Oscillospiraceae bacterium]|nr:ABC transporter permease [Oscillospiraceae bacterium]
MGFQRLLATRYILAQKRHSILTICSIIAALTLMTMLFTGFSTILSCVRASEYDQRPYHCCVFNVTEAQCALLEECEGIRSAKLEKNAAGDGYDAHLMFSYSVDDEVMVLNEAFKKAGLNITTENVMDYELNHNLMKYDVVGINGRFELAQLFALFYIFIIFFALAMRLIIDTAFEISSKERERQFGVLQSIGATPRQIVGIITMEGTLLSLIGIPCGMLLGSGLAYAAFRLIVDSGLTEAFVEPEKTDAILRFSVNPWLMLASAVTGLVWVWLSAYATGMRIIKMSPVQAIQNRSEKVKRVSRHTLLGLFFGWKGKLAARNTRRAPKRFAITVVSLTLSITLFASFTYALDAYDKGMIQLQEQYALDHDYVLRHEEVDEEMQLIHPLAYQETIRKMEQSGLFQDIQMETFEGASYLEPDSDNRQITIQIQYMNETRYNSFFDGAPPISYEEFSDRGGYIQMTMNEEVAEKKAYDASEFENWKSVRKLYDLTRIDAERIVYDKLTIEEYDALPEEEKSGYHEEYAFSLDDESELIGYSCLQFEPVSYDIIMSYDISETGLANSENMDYVSAYGVTLIAPLSLYETAISPKLETAWNINIYCNLADPSLEMNEKAIRYMEEDVPVTLVMDMFSMNWILRSTLALMKIICGFILAAVAIIALVNMVNIISTGILNRRSEMAGMQCVGMTERQLYGVTLIECVQYALSSGLSATVLCVVLLFGTEKFLELMMLEADFENLINYFEPLPVVWISAAAALLVAVVTALISLHGMRRDALIDQIRKVD